MKLVSLVILFVVSTVGYSQFYKPTSISLKSRGGYLIAHRAVMSHLIQQNNYGFELEFSKHRNDQKEFEKLGRPVSGISFIYQDFGYREVLGQGIGIFQHYSQPIIANEKFGFLDFRFGSGAGIVTKKYDPIKNPKNNAIGSHFNAVIDIQLSYKKHIKKLHFGMGIGISHYSNAALLQPNLGLNTPYIDLCVGYNFEERELKKPFDGDQPNTPIYQKLKSLISITAIGSSRQNLAGGELPKSYAVLGLQAFYSQSLGYHWRIDGGFDLILNNANRFRDPSQTFGAGEALQFGVNLGPTARLYKTEVYINFGYYLIDKIDAAGRIYNRIGYRYLFNKYLYGMIGIKAHFGKADYIEFGFGIRFFDAERSNTVLKNEE